MADVPEPDPVAGSGDVPGRQGTPPPDPVPGEDGGSAGRPGDRPDPFDRFDPERFAELDPLEQLDELARLDESARLDELTAAADPVPPDDLDDDAATDPAAPAPAGTGLFAATGAPGRAVADFRRLAARIAEEVLGLAPENAPAGTRAARSGRLADLGPDGVAHAGEVLADALTALDAVDDTVLDVGDVVDLEILRVWVAGRQLEVMERRHERDPLAHVPARLVPVAPALPGAADAEPSRRGRVDSGALETVVGLLRCTAGRLDALPERLATGRRTVEAGGLPAVTVDAALRRTRRLHATLAADVAALTGPVGVPDTVTPGLSAALGRALEALAAHADWLVAVRPTADGDPRLGGRRYGARLWYDLDVELDPDALLVRAESDLLAVEEELAELAGLLGAAPGRDGVRDLLRAVSVDADVPAGAAPDAVRARARAAAALAEVADEIRALELVTIPDDADVAAHCLLDGRFETALPDTPTLTAAGGALRRVVAAHVGVPGHAVQAAHAERAVLPTATRRLLPSLPFVEGWAVHAEGLLTLSDAGTPAQRARRRVAHLGLRLRRAARCVVDVRCHVHGMSDAEAEAFLTDRAHLPPAAAAAQLTSTLVHPVRGSVGYVGDHLVADVVARLAAARPDDPARAVHDRVLAHGPVPPRHLAVLLGLPAEASGRP